MTEVKGVRDMELTLCPREVVGVNNMHCFPVISDLVKVTSKKWLEYWAIEFWASRSLVCPILAVFSHIKHIWQLLG